MNLEELLARARRYWPETLDWIERGEQAPEAPLRFAHCEQEKRQKGKQWHTLVSELAQELPGFSVRDATAPSDFSFRCSVYLPRLQRKTARDRIVVGCLSMLAPMYAIYGVQYEYVPRSRGRISDIQMYRDELPPDMRGPADALARRMEATFGFEPLPFEFARTPVPLCVDVTCPPRTTLFDALISDKAESVP